MPDQVRYDDVLERLPVPLLEIVGVGLDAQLAGRGRDDVVGDAFPLGIGLGFFQRLEVDRDLGLGVGAAGPAGQRIGALGRMRFEFQHPFAGARLTGLVDGFRKLEDASGQCLSLGSERALYR